MTEIYGGAIPDNAAAAAMPDMLSSGAAGGLMASLGEGFAHAFPTLELNRVLAENVATTGIDPSTGLAIPAIQEAPQMSAEEATEQYGIPGALRFDSDVPASVAAEMNDRKREELARQDIINRSPIGGVAGTALQFAGSLPGIADPLMIASGFIPAVPAARAAIMSASLGGRAALGAIQGAVAGAALTPVFYGLAKQDQEDYGAVDALLNIALGGVAGGVGHAVFGRAPGLHGETGGADDALAHADPAATLAAAEAPAPAREAMLTGSIAALADDRPVDLPPELTPRAAPSAARLELAESFEGEQGTVETYRIVTPTGDGTVRATIKGNAARIDDINLGPLRGPGELGTAATRQLLRQFQTLHPEVTELSGFRVSGARAAIGAAAYVHIPIAPGEFADAPPTTPGARPYETLPAEPMRLASWLQQQGGVIDEGGDVAASGGRDRPGLINAAGLPLDEATLRAWQEGYLPGDERPDINTLLDAVNNDLHGSPVYSDQDELQAIAHREAIGRNAEIDRYAQDFGISTEDKTREQFWNEVADHLSTEDLAREITSHDEAEAEAYTRFEQAAAAEGWQDRDAGPARTLEEMEDAYRQEEAADGPRETAAGDRGPDIERLDQGVGEGGVGPRGRGVGARPGEPPEAEPGRPGAAGEVADPLDDLEAENTTLESELRQARGEDEEEPAELTAANEALAAEEGRAKAIEQAGACLARRA